MFFKIFGLRSEIPQKATHCVAFFVIRKRKIELLEILKVSDGKALTEFVTELVGKFTYQK